MARVLTSNQSLISREEQVSASSINQHLQSYSKVQHHGLISHSYRHCINTVTLNMSGASILYDNTRQYTRLDVQTEAAWITTVSQE